MTLPDPFDALPPDDPAWKGLLAGIPAVAPPARVRAALLARIAEPPPAGFTFAFAADAEFAPVPHAPGVSARVLHVDEAAGRFTCILKMAPGARYPAHRHDGPEECVVLAGSIVVGGVRLRAGDYQRAAADTDHVEQWTTALCPWVS